MITADFETRSACSLKDAGTYHYAEHPTTTVNCLAFAFDDEPEGYLWHPAFPNAYIKKGTKFEPAPIEEQRPDALDELFDRLAIGEIIEAHNAFFERCIWHFVMVGKFRWPAIDDDQWQCSAAKAASFGLPRKLEHVAKALKLPLAKDMVGNRLAVKMSKPRKPLKREWSKNYESPEAFTREEGLLWYEEAAELEQLFEYCKQDVRVEHAVSGQLRDLSPVERATWLLDQQINWRGVACDRAMVDKALALVHQANERSNNEVFDLTTCEVTSCSKRIELLAWVQSEGVNLPNTQAETIDRFLEAHDLPDHVHRVLEIWRYINRTSTKKYRAMHNRLSDDGRIRDTLLYWAAHTGRWAGRGIQPQNFPRGSVKNMDEVCADILALSFDELAIVYGDVMDLLSGALRGALWADDGQDLMSADYSAIEARGTFWLAGDERALNVLRRYDRGEGPDIYKVQAGEIYHVNPAGVTPAQRQMGKQAVLGLGYQMGAQKFQETCAGYGIFIDEDFAKEVVRSYRDAHPEVVDFWNDVERAAIAAVQRGSGAKPVPCGPVRWAVRGRFLHCRLPSGRLLSYCDPSIALEPVPWDEDDLRPKLRYWGVDSMTRQWKRLATYGGKLTENLVQALSRDIMRDAMLRIEEHGVYKTILTVHDEIVTEVPEGKGDLKEFEAIMAEQPEWAPGFPIAAEGWRGKRYRK